MYNTSSQSLRSLIRSKNDKNNLEGECRVRNSTPMKLNLLKTIILLPILVIVTITIILFIIRKNKKLRALLIYSECTINQAQILLIQGTDQSYQLSDIIRNSNQEDYFFYRNVKYNFKQKSVAPVSYDLLTTNYFQNPSEYLKRGISEQQYNQALEKYGYCQHLVQIPSILVYLFDQLTGIFFILQYFICAIYIIQLFYNFAIAMIAMSVLTTTINYFLLRSSYKKIKQMSEKQIQVEVIRNSQIKKINSRELVPGDIFIPKKLLPCDSIIVQGEVYMNQANLTGQNIPIGKFPPQNYNQTKQEKCWLYEGSTLLQSRSNALAMVVHTGFITRKGRIIRKILFRQSDQPEFFKYGFYFLIEIIVFCTIIYFVLLKVMIDNQISITQIVLRFFDMLGWAAPPIFPIFFNLSYSFSIYRLSRKNIYGTQPFKTIISGKVKTLCFDKTGTLTQNHMDLYSIIRFINESTKNQQLVTKFGQAQKLQAKANLINNNPDDLVTKLFATCHTVRLINEELMGDELDLRMFQYSQFTYQNSQKVDVILKTTKLNQSLEIIRVNQFQSKFQSMSVIVRQVNTNKNYIFVKGSPEKIYANSITKFHDYQNLVQDISLKGFRSLAFGYKQIDNINKYLSLSREQLQKNIKILGLVTFSNRLKNDTVDTITKIKDADIQTKIITGDNIYIGVETGFRAGFISQNQKIIILEGALQVDQINYKAKRLWKQNGNTFKQDINLSKLEYLTQTSPMAIDNQFLLKAESLPNTIRIFARITPQSKALVITRIKRIKMEDWSNKSNWDRLTGRTCEKVGMVGDGANDIMAIKEADLGIGISQTDSSYAANFTIQNLIDVEQIIREGRSTLRIVIQIFRYYGAISVLKYTGSMILVWDKASYADNQFTYVNYAQILEIVIFLTLSYPSKKLSKYIPNDNSLCLQNHLSYLGQTIIATCGLIVIYAYFLNTPQYIPNPSGYYANWVQSCHSTTVIFLSSQMYYIFCSISLYTSQPWKNRIYTNIILTIWLILVIGINISFFFISANLKTFFNLTEISIKSGGIIFAITMGFVSLGYIWESIVRSLKLYQN